MKIVSKFRDVYDLQAKLYDESQTWVRKTESIKVLDCDEELVMNVVAFTTRSLNRYNREDNLHVRMVFVAGQVYPLYNLKYAGREQDQAHVSGALAVEDFVSFDPAKILARMKELGFITEDKSNSMFFRSVRSEKQFNQLVSKINSELVPQATKVLKELNVPLAFVSGRKKGLVEDNDTQERYYWDITTDFCFNDLRMPWWEIEPNLYILHQILGQYIFGVLKNAEPQMIETSEKTRLEAHGFSNKFSFRNMERN